MSTLKDNITAKRMALLATVDGKLFHIQDFANLWGITNKNTLKVLLKRYCDSKVLFRIYRGFYSLIHPSKINPILLGARALHQYYDALGKLDKEHFDHERILENLYKQIGKRKAGLFSPETIVP